MKALAIIGLSVLAAVVYGIIHDQITARICVEYFTIGHARLIDSDSPTVLGLFWGVVATWWVGLPLGAGLAIAARAGRRCKLGATDLLPSLAKLLLTMFTVATLAGCIGYFGSKAGVFILIEPFATRVPADRHIAFLTCGWAHATSYLAGIFGGITLWILTWRRRKAPLTV
ncbi:MAG TPA: hypothetical protein VGE67_02935 [Haloferula sp.]